MGMADVAIPSIYNIWIYFRLWLVSAELPFFEEFVNQTNHSSIRPSVPIGLPV